MGLIHRACRQMSMCNHPVINNSVTLRASVSLLSVTVHTFAVMESPVSARNSEDDFDPSKPFLGIVVCCTSIPPEQRVRLPSHSPSVSLDSCGHVLPHPRLSNLCSFLQANTTSLSSQKSRKRLSSLAVSISTI